jgi:hypothetical protein
MPIKAHLIIEHIMYFNQAGLYEVKGIWDGYNAGKAKLFKRPDEEKFTTLNNLKSLSKTTASLTKFL